MPRTPPLLPAFARAALALVIAASICAALPGDLLAVSDFVSEEPPFAQDWTVTYGVPGLPDKAAAAAAASNVVMAREAGSGMGDGLKGADSGNQKWYFTSPQSFFAFDTVAAYNGVIQWRLHSLSWLDSFTAKPPPDIILTCAPRSLSLMAKGIVSDRFVGSVFSLPLNETGNWFFLKPSVSGQGAAMRLQPTRTEFQECLAGLHTVSIRGGYYNGAEKTVLKFVRVVEGAVDASPSKLDAAADDVSSSAAAAAGGSVGFEYRVLWNRAGDCNVQAARITIAQAAGVDLCPQPVGSWPGTDDLVFPRGPWLKAPFVQSLAFKALPLICTSARLIVKVVGRSGQRLTLGPNNHVVVYAGTEVRTPLGKLFNNLDSLLNEDRQLFELADSLAVAAVHMAALTAGGGQVVFTMHTPPGIDFEFKIVSAELAWKQGTCFSVLLTSTALVQDASFRGASSDEAARAIGGDDVELLFRMPAAISSKVIGDGALQLMAEGDTGPAHHIEVADALDRPLGLIFYDEQVTSESAVIWSGHAKHIPPPPSTVFLLEGVQQPESRVVGAFLRVAELGLSGGGQERKIVAWSSATGAATLESEWDARSVPTLQTRLEIVRVSYFALQGNGTAAVRVPLQFRKEWIPLPRSLAQSSLNGHLALRLRVRSYSSPKSKVRVPVVRVVFPLAGGYMDGLRPGSSDVMGVALSRPSHEILRFRAPLKVPLGPGTIIAEIFFQDHKQLVARNAGNTLTSSGDEVDVGAAMDLGFGLPLAPQQLYPHGYAAVRLLAGDRGESIGFFLSDDYSQYEPSASFVSHVQVSQTTLAALVAAGDLHFTLVIPPGTGVIRVQSFAISYPA